MQFCREKTIVREVVFVTQTVLISEFQKKKTNIACMFNIVQIYTKFACIYNKQYLFT